MKDKDGKSIYNRTSKPCGIKKNKKLDAMMRMMFDPENKESSDDHDSFMWQCPIKKVCISYWQKWSRSDFKVQFQGVSIIAPEEKDMKFPLMVPSFLSTTGKDYIWMEVFLTKKNGKWENILTVTKPFDIGIAY